MNITSILKMAAPVISTISTILCDEVSPKKQENPYGVIIGETMKTIGQVICEDIDHTSPSNISQSSNNEVIETVRNKQYVWESNLNY